MFYNKRMFHAALAPGLELRMLEERHAPQLFAVIDGERDYLRTWLAWVDATETVEDTTTFIKSALELFATNAAFAAAIWNQSEIAGVIGLHKIDWLNRKVEIGYWLASGFQGKGIMTAACRAMISHAFGELDLHRVSIECAVGNEKSCAIPRRLGFTAEGTRREAQLLSGRYHDTLVFSMLKQDWK